MCIWLLPGRLYRDLRDADAEREPDGAGGMNRSCELDICRAGLNMQLELFGLQAPVLKEFM